MTLVGKPITLGELASIIDAGQRGGMSEALKTYAQGPGHETPAEEPPRKYKDPDTQKIDYHPNEADLGLHDEPHCDEDEEE